MSFIYLDVGLGIKPLLLHTLEDNARSLQDVGVVQVGEGGARLLGPLHLLVSALVPSLNPRGRLAPRLWRLGQAWSSCP